MQIFMCIIVQNDPPRDAENGLDAVQLTPQHVHINLRPSKVITHIFCDILHIYASTFGTISHHVNVKMCGSATEWLGIRTCDQQVVRGAECNLGQVVCTHLPLSPSSTIWYQPMGGDARRLGR